MTNVKRASISRAEGDRGLVKILKIPAGRPFMTFQARLSHDRERLNDLVACTKLHDAAEIPRRADQDEQAAG